MREGVELFDADDGDVAPVLVAAFLQQVVVNLAAAQHDAADLCIGQQFVDFANHRAEGAARQFLQVAHRQFVAQERFGRHHNQRFAEGAEYLAAQQVEDLRGRGRHADAHVVFRAQLQVALQPRRGVLRPLAFVAVRQQHGEATVASPFGFAGGDELVNQHLRAVGKVAELRFPDGQPQRFGGGVAVFKAEYRRL